MITDGPRAPKVLPDKHGIVKKSKSTKISEFFFTVTQRNVQKPSKQTILNCPEVATKVMDGPEVSEFAAKYMHQVDV